MVIKITALIVLLMNVVIQFCIFNKKLKRLEKRLADDLEKIYQSMQIKKSSCFREGYEIITNYMEGYSEVKFVVSSHGWTQLEDTLEWENFQKLLLEVQKQ